MGTIDTLLRIKADASQAVRGLLPLQASLDETAQDAQVTEQALNNLDGAHKITVNDAEVEAARAEITRLRDMMRSELSADINADTSEAEKRIKTLQRTIKVLDQENVVVEVDVHADTSELAGLGGLFGGVSTLAEGGVGIMSRFSGAVSGAGAGALAASTGIGAAALALGVFNQQAADAQTSITQLDALTGGLGEETFGELQEWAASTPFAIDDATEATKRLVAAGVPLQDIPDWLNDIGNVASATGVPIEQVGTIFAQMVSKGKASYEELQQLAEAGVPVWQVLADKIGVSVAEVQKMATEGKLTADAIDLARESLNQLYPTAMQDQAETFNGQMSTFRDTLSQIGQNLGKVFLPVLSDLLSDLNDIAEAGLWAADKIGWLGDKIADMSDKAAAGHDDRRTTVDDLYDLGLATRAWELPGKVWDIATTPPDWFPGEDEKQVTEEVGEAVEGTSGLIDNLADKVVSGMSDATAATEALAEAMKEAEERIEETIEAFSNIGGNIRTTVDFIISADDLEEEIRATLRGVDEEGIENDIPPISLPATLTLGQVADLGDKQQQLVSSISSFVQQGLDEGARRAEIVPGFDEDKWYAQVRRETRGLLIDAGIDPENANRVLTRMFGLRREVPVGADVSGAKDDLKALTGTTVNVSANFVPYVSAEAKAKATNPLAMLIGPQAVDGAIPAPIAPQVVESDAAASTLDGVAMPEGVARRAKIIPLIDNATLMIARSVLHELTKTETKTIKINLDETGGSLTGATDRMMSGGGGTGGGGGGRSGGNEVRIAPRQTPVAVYLDGAEIGDRIDLRRGLAATESVRRIA